MADDTTPGDLERDLGIEIQSRLRHVLSVEYELELHIQVLAREEAYEISQYRS